jgi:hypothetical protein
MTAAKPTSASDRRWCLAFKSLLQRQNRSFRFGHLDQAREQKPQRPRSSHSVGCEDEMPMCHRADSVAIRRIRASNFVLASTARIRIRTIAANRHVKPAIVKPRGQRISEEIAEPLIVILGA